MYQLLLRLMLLSALLKLGISVSDFYNCKSVQCQKRIDKGFQEVLHVDWKPISVFPEEAKRFR